MEDQDLRDIGITDTSHRKKILHAARAFPKVTSHPQPVKHVLEGFTCIMKWIYSLKVKINLTYYLTIFA